MNTPQVSIKVIGEGVVVEQLSEKAIELVQVALKFIRPDRDENPTPVDYETVFHSLIEELGDVRVCITVLGHSCGKLDTQDTEKQKLER